MATSAAAKAPAAAAAVPKKSKLALIIALVVVLLAGAGAGWFFLARETGEDEEDTRAASKTQIFVPLDQFTVNLQPEDGQQFLQVAMTLKVVDQPTADAIKAVLPEVRSRVLLLLSSKKPSQIASLEGKAKLADEIIREVEQPLPQEKKKKRKGKTEEAGDGKPKKAKGKAKAEEQEAEEDAPERVLAVFFTHFIVQ
jgi:flagellar protein FliL